MKVNTYFIATLLFLTSYAAHSNGESEEQLQQRNQHFSQHYQSVCSESYKFINLTSSIDDHVQEELLINGVHNVNVKLGSEGHGYLQLAIPEWGTKLIVGHSVDTSVSILGAGMYVAKSKNIFCDELNMVSHFEIHEWGSYTLKVVAKKDSDLNISIIKIVD